MLWRGKPTGAQGHVAFYSSALGERVLLLGGNQQNAVSLQAYPKTRVLSYHWPPGVPIP